MFHKGQATSTDMLGIIGGAALLTAAPFSLQWSQKTVALSFDSADARIGRPRTALSVAGVQRRAYRRAVRSTVYAGAAAAAVGYGVGAYYGGYGYPAYTAPSSPSYGTGYGYGSYYGSTAIRATPPHLTIPALLSASGGVDEGSRALGAAICCGCSRPVIALNGRVEVGSRVSVLRGEADFGGHDGPSAYDPILTCLRLSPGDTKLQFADMLP